VDGERGEKGLKGMEKIFLQSGNARKKKVGGATLPG